MSWCGQIWCQLVSVGVSWWCKYANEVLVSVGVVRFGVNWCQLVSVGVHM